MTKDTQSFDKIEPTDIPLTQPQAATEQPTRQNRQKPMVGVALAIVLLLALAVVFVLPEMVRPPELVSNTQPSDVSPPPQPGKPIESPWQEEQLSKARRAAQDILAKLIERQQFLEKKSVHLWAVERYQEAITAAEAGDMNFRNRDFNAALSKYEQSLSIFTDLEQQADQVVADNLSAGFKAIAAGDPPKARQHFELVQAIEPSNTQAKSGLARSETLPKVFGILDDARVAEESNQLQAAKNHYQQALQLDPAHKAASDGLARINKRIVERNYVQALSKGYTFLEQNNLSGAATAFQQALKLRPDAAEAKRALEQTRNRQSRLTLQNQLQQAQQREREESWRAAEALYGQILRNDNSVVDARVGQIRARTRAELDEKLQNWIDNPLKLSSSTEFQQAESALGEARAIENRGAKLNRQIAAMQTVLIMATTPWPVEFKSDNATNVTLFRVGELGQFEQKTLKLKPGNYIVAGTRKGYRDVRLEFQVTGGNTNPVVVRCEEPI